MMNLSESLCETDSYDFSHLISIAESSFYSTGSDENIKDYYENWDFVPINPEPCTNFCESINYITLTPIKSNDLEEASPNDLPLTVYSFDQNHLATKNGEISLQKRRGRSRKDWDEIEKKLKESNLDSESRRKVKNNISSANYRYRKTQIEVEISEKCKAMKRKNFELARKSSILEESLRKLRRIQNNFFESELLFCVEQYNNNY